MTRGNLPTYADDIVEFAARIWDEAGEETICLKFTKPPPKPHPTSHLTVLRNPAHQHHNSDGYLSPALHNASSCYTRFLEAHAKKPHTEDTSAGLGDFRKGLRERARSFTLQHAQDMKELRLLRNHVKQRKGEEVVDKLENSPMMMHLRDAIDTLRKYSQLPRDRSIGARYNSENESKTDDQALSGLDKVDEQASQWALTLRTYYSTNHVWQMRRRIMEEVSQQLENLETLYAAKSQYITQAQMLYEGNAADVAASNPPSMSHIFVIETAADTLMIFEDIVQDIYAKAGIVFKEDVPYCQDEKEADDMIRYLFGDSGYSSNRASVDLSTTKPSPQEENSGGDTPEFIQEQKEKHARGESWSLTSGTPCIEDDDDDDDTMYSWMLSPHQDVRNPSTENAGESDHGSGNDPSGEGETFVRDADNQRETTESSPVADGQDESVSQVVDQQETSQTSFEVDGEDEPVSQVVDTEDSDHIPPTREQKGKGKDTSEEPEQESISNDELQMYSREKDGDLVCQDSEIEDSDEGSIPRRKTLYLTGLEREELLSSLAEYMEQTKSEEDTTGHLPSILEETFGLSGNEDVEEEEDYPRCPIHESKTVASSSLGPSQFSEQDPVDIVDEAITSRSTINLDAQTPNTHLPSPAIPLRPHENTTIVAPPLANYHAMNAIMPEPIVLSLPYDLPIMVRSWSAQTLPTIYEEVSPDSKPDSDTDTDNGFPSPTRVYHESYVLFEPSLGSIDEVDEDHLEEYHTLYPTLYARVRHESYVLFEPSLRPIDEVDEDQIEDNDTPSLTPDYSENQGEGEEEKHPQDSSPWSSDSDSDSDACSYFKFIKKEAKESTTDSQNNTKTHQNSRTPSSSDHDNSRRSSESNSDSDSDACSYFKFMTKEAKEATTNSKNDIKPRRNPRTPPSSDQRASSQWRKQVLGKRRSLHEVPRVSDSEPQRKTAKVMYGGVEFVHMTAYVDPWQTEAVELK